MPIRTRAEAFDEWMRRYVENPDEYEHEFEAVRRFLEEEGGSKPTTYGEACASYLTLLERGEEAEALRAQPARPRRERK